MVLRWETWPWFQFCTRPKTAHFCWEFEHMWHKNFRHKGESVPQKNKVCKHDQTWPQLCQHARPPFPSEVRVIFLGSKRQETNLNSLFQLWDDFGSRISSPIFLAIDLGVLQSTIISHVFLPDLTLHHLIITLSSACLLLWLLWLSRVTQTAEHLPQRQHVVGKCEAARLGLRSSNWKFQLVQRDQ